MVRIGDEVEVELAKVFFKSDRGFDAHFKKLVFSDRGHFETTFKRID